MTPEQQEVIEEAEAHLEAMKLSYGWPLTPYVDLLTLAKELEPKWKPIETAPDDEFVLLLRPSGYTSTPYEVVTGYRRKEYRGDAWLDVGNDRLSESGAEPTHWMYQLEPPK